jgi:hypothetical protein
MVKRWSQAGIVAISAVVVGVAAYLVALAMGASHTVCGGTTGAVYCDTRATRVAVVALVAGALWGAAVAAWVLHRRTSNTRG